MDDVLRVMLELLPAFCDAWQRGRVSRWFLILSLVGSIVLPAVAMSVVQPVAHALLWGTTVLVWLVFMAALVVGCRADKESPEASPPRG